MKYNDLSFGQAEAVFNKLGGIEGVKDFLSGKTIVIKAPSNEEARTKVWKMIKLDYKSADHFVNYLAPNNALGVSKRAKEMLNNSEFKVSKKEECQLVNISVKQLGFDISATYKEICDKAKEFGLELCSHEVGPQLRLQYKDQPNGEHLYIAMEPITCSNGKLHIFEVASYPIQLGYNVYTLYLSCTEYPSNPICNWHDRFIFCFRK
jgi:hypothetical protein